MLSAGQRGTVYDVNLDEKVMTMAQARNYLTAVEMKAIRSCTVLHPSIGQICQPLSNWPASIYTQLL